MDKSKTGRMEELPRKSPIWVGTLERQDSNNPVVSSDDDNQKLASSSHSRLRDPDCVHHRSVLEMKELLEEEVSKSAHMGVKQKSLGIRQPSGSSDHIRRHSEPNSAKGPLLSRVQSLTYDHGYQYNRTGGINARDFSSPDRNFARSHKQTDSFHGPKGCLEPLRTQDHVSRGGGEFSFFLPRLADSQGSSKSVSYRPFDGDVLKSCRETEMAGLEQDVKAGSYIKMRRASDTSSRGGRGNRTALVRGPRRFSEGYMKEAPHTVSCAAAGEPFGVSQRMAVTSPKSNSRFNSIVSRRN